MAVATKLRLQGGAVRLTMSARIASDLIGRNKLAVEKLRQDGSCDISYSLPSM